MNADELKRFAEADKKVHKVESEWHFPIMTKFGYKADTLEGIGFVRSYKYTHPVTSNKVTVATGVHADYFDAPDGHGYWADLEPYLKKIHGDLG